MASAWNPLPEEPVRGPFHYDKRCADRMVGLHIGKRVGADRTLACTVNRHTPAMANPPLAVIVNVWLATSVNSDVAGRIDGSAGAGTGCDR